jgi:hypothetical protein
MTRFFKGFVLLLIIRRAFQQPEHGIHKGLRPWRAAGNKKIHIYGFPEVFIKLKAFV